MLADILCYPVRSLAAPFWEDEGAHYAGLGAALGAAVGLVPKDNLTAALLAILVLSLRLNVAVAALSGLFFAWVGWFSDDWLDLTGAAILEHEALYPLWNRFFELPWAGWTRLDNTVVVGSLVAGIAFAGPAYAAARVVHALLAAPIDRALRRRPWMGQVLGPQYLARRGEPGDAAPGLVSPRSVEGALP